MPDEYNLFHNSMANAAFKCCAASVIYEVKVLSINTLGKANASGATQLNNLKYELAFNISN